VKKSPALIFHTGPGRLGQVIVIWPPARCFLFTFSNWPN